MIRTTLMAAAITTGLLCGGCSDARPAEDRETVTVFAAASTTGPLTEIARRYEARTGRKVVLSFHSSSTLARQTAHGARADVYISANPTWMDVLQQKKLLKPGARHDLLANRLALIAPADSSLPAVTIAPGKAVPEALAGVRIATGAFEHVPAGTYAREALQSVGWWERLQPRLAPAATVRAALRFVEQGQCGAGIVYASDAVTSPKVRTLAVFPSGSHSPIRYPVAILRDASGSASGFVDSLAGTSAVAVFRAFGFTPLPRPVSARPRLPETEGLHTRAAVTAAGLSLKVAAGCLAVIAVPGILLGWLLARKRFPGQGLLEAVVHAPLVMTPVVTGYLLLLGLGRQSPLGRWLKETVGWSPAFTWQAAVIAAAVMSLPLLVRSVRVAVELVDRRLEQAASTLGACPLRVLVGVTLPLALPGIVGGLVLAAARSLGEFGATAMFAGSVPGTTQTLPLAIYNLTQAPGGETAALQLAGLSVVLSVAALAGSEWMTRRMRSGAREAG